MKKTKAQIIKQRALKKMSAWGINEIKIGRKVVRTKSHNGQGSNIPEGYDDNGFIK